MYRPAPGLPFACAAAAKVSQCSLESDSLRCSSSAKRSPAFAILASKGVVGKLIARPCGPPDDIEIILAEISLRIGTIVLGGERSAIAGSSLPAAGQNMAA